MSVLELVSLKCERNVSHALKTGSWYPSERLAPSPFKIGVSPPGASTHAGRKFSVFTCFLSVKKSHKWLITPEFLTS